MQQMCVQKHHYGERLLRCDAERRDGRAAVAAMAMFLVLTCLGCGQRGCPITGEVTFNGKPVAEGTIALEPADGQGVTTGGRIVDGKYSLVDNAAPMVGKKLVRIMAARKTGRRIPAGPPAPPTMMIDEIVRYIPDIYNQRTTLACEVAQDGPRQIDFHLKSQ